MLNRVEGRTWYTPYRGKLWIASTGIRISRQDVAVHEKTYTFIEGGRFFEVYFKAEMVMYVPSFFVIL